MWELLTAPLCPVLSRRRHRAVWRAVAASPPAPVSADVTKGPVTPCPISCPGDRAALCHKGPMHTLPPALGPPPAHPKWPSLEGIPHPKCLRHPDRIFRNGSNHQQMLPCPVLQAQRQPKPACTGDCAPSYRGCWQEHLEQLLAPLLVSVRSSYPMLEFFSH